MSLLRRLGHWFTRKHSRPIRRQALLRPAVEMLEARLAPAVFIEAEVNDTFATANVVNIATGDILTMPANDWLIISGSIDPAADVDVYQFTIGADSGVFFDIDAQNVDNEGTPLSSLDSFVEVFDAGMVAVPGGSNNNGFDFQGFPVPPGATAATASPDSSLYLDLLAGTYYVRVTSSGAATSGGYELRLLADDSYTTTVPLFNSMPTAVDTLYLDFTGHASVSDAWTTRDTDPGVPVVPNGPYVADPFDFNADDTEYSPAERLAIRNIWRIVAEDYSPFRINVSTSAAIGAINGVGFQMVITNSDSSIIGEPPGLLGISFLNSYASGTDDNVAFTFADSFTTYAGNPSGVIMARALEQGGTVSHEFGHALGLKHFAPSGAINRIMSTTGLGLRRGRWAFGVNVDNAIQDDMAVISNSTNTFGYRVDDYGNSIATTSLATTAPGGYRNVGIIERITDRDVFRFTGAGPTRINVDVDDYVNNLDIQVRLLNAAGGQLAISADPISFDGEIVFPSLPQGTYYVEVRGTGADGDAGGYTLTIRTAVTSVQVYKGNLVVNDTALNGKNDTLEISRVGDNVRVYDPNFELAAGPGATQVDANTVDVPLLNFVGKILVNTLGGNDQLTLNLTTGNPIPLAGLIYNGGIGTNTLIASNTDNLWIVSALNGGKIDNLRASFVNVQNLFGGTMRDVFYFGTNGRVTGYVDGGPGSNWLNYSAIASGIIANLETGVASRVTGPVRNINNVIGSALGSDRITGNDNGGVLVGKGRANLITAGDGPTILIGGFGVNSLLGGGASDLLINGYTKYDNNVVRLEEIFAIWTTADPYLTRIANLQAAGPNQLAVGATVFLHPGVTAGGVGIRYGTGNFVYLSTLFGGANSDWFLTRSLQTLFDRKPNEVVTMS